MTAQADRNKYLREWKKRNPEKVRQYSRNSYRKFPLKVRDKSLRRKFGITLLQYEAMRKKQKSRCAICAVDRPGGKGDWHLDHDHRTKQVRGLLCQNCNIGLGSFKDDPVKLNKAARYLRKHRNFYTLKDAENDKGYIRIRQRRRSNRRAG